MRCPGCPTGGPPPSRARATIFLVRAGDCGAAPELDRTCPGVRWARAVKILFVENHRVFAETVASEFLTPHEVVVVPTVKAAESELDGAAYDVALVDYDLDDLKGDELVQRLRRSGSTMPVIAVSSHDDGNDALMRAGANAVCRKSDFARVSQILGRVVSRTVGRIAVLNGPSSSGKTTLARRTRDVLGTSAVALSLDDFFTAVHPARRNDWALFLSLTHVLFDAAASFCRQGFDVVVDTVFERPECLAACRLTLPSFPLVLVRVDCPVDVLSERERLGGDRRPGLAEDQARRVHIGCIYDLELDTSISTPDACAREIAAALATYQRGGGSARRRG
jgi:chloramphenicol 3-O-phosphotransferase